MNTVSEFNFKVKGITNLKNGSFTWQSPSNIALVKYWGKKENQVPANPSLSFTLSNCYTQTNLQFCERTNYDEKFSFKVLFNNKENSQFRPKIGIFFERILQYMPFLVNYDFVIRTTNSFPHSSGIASSASGMSALALCLMSIEKSLNNNMTEDYFKKKASFLARLGSGSASRSIDGGVIVWGFHQQIKGSTDLYGIKFPYPIHKNFKNYQDTILLVDKGEKQVSSTVGHRLMINHPFAKVRFKQAIENITKLKNILQIGDLDAFVNLVESEALTLHAMMMTSNPYFILMKTNTLKIIDKIWEFRKSSGLKVCFTLDAGANVHVLYPASDTKKILYFIENELVEFCQNNHYICDSVGLGSVNLS